MEDLNNYKVNTVSLDKSSSPAKPARANEKGPRNVCEAGAAEETTQHQKAPNVPLP